MSGGVLGPDSVGRIRHRALGDMVRLSLPEISPIDLTLHEALTLSRAVLAVCDGKSTTDEIYMSPIACDTAFSAAVTPNGLWLKTVELNWDDTRRLGELLHAAAQGPVEP